jgi:hypothetical protein
MLGTNTYFMSIFEYFISLRGRNVERGQMLHGLESDSYDVSVRRTIDIEYSSVSGKKRI